MSARVVFDLVCDEPEPVMAIASCLSCKRNSLPMDPARMEMWVDAHFNDKHLAPDAEGSFRCRGPVQVTISADRLRIYRAR